MWKINKPSLNRAIGKDIKDLINNSKTLDNTVEGPLKLLYRRYDAQNGHVTDVQLNTITEEQAEAIFKMYKQTYEHKSLSYIRDELMSNIYKCPYCSINQPDTLDHYMPEEQYKALAAYRMNLIPMCSRCNTYKGTKPYNQFIHCYYDSFPTKQPFLKANVFTIKNRFVVKFHFDTTAINDVNLEKKLVYQEKEIRLFERIRKEATVFITSICRDCEQNDTASLIAWLKNRLAQKEQQYGSNDWRCAVIRGMLAYQNLDISQIKYNKTKSLNVNAGGI